MPSKKDQQTFIGQGSYGCVYTPGIDCNGKKNKKNYITKIQEVDFFSNNEIEISNKIISINGYKKYFSPIIKSCKIVFNKIKNSSISLNKCSTLFEDYVESKTNKQTLTNYDKYLQDQIKNTYYSLSYIKFIENIKFKHYFDNIKNTHTFLSNVVLCYMHLLNGIEIIIENEELIAMKGNVNSFFNHIHKIIKN